MKSYGDFTINRYWFTGIINVCAYAAIYYSLVNWQIPRYFEKGKWVLFGGSLILSTTIIVLTWYVATLFISQFYVLHEGALPQTLGPYFLETVQMFVPGCILLAWESFNEKQEEEERLHQLQKEHLSNELKYLKAQINPTFLFNTLKSLQSFVQEESPKAPDIIIRLSAMLDYLLYRSQKPQLHLKEEIAAIEDFIALEKLRYENQLQVILSIKGDMSSMVSPLVFLSILQEFLKEDILKNGNPISLNIDISDTDNKIVFEINSSDTHSISNEKLKLIRRQLDLSYADAYQFTETSTNGLKIILKKGDD